MVTTAKEGREDGVVENGVDDEFSLTLDEIDIDVTDELLIPDVLKEKPSDTDVEDCCIVIDNIPVVDSAKLEKLKQVISKLIKRLSQDYKDEYPTDENGMSKGYCFVEFPSVDLASQAAQFLHGHRLDKAHTFAVNLFSDLKKIKKPDPNWQPPDIRQYKDSGNLWWWLESDTCTDQYAVQHDDGNRLTVYWNGLNEPQIVNEKSDRERWTETTFYWSPHGTYMATVHAPGVALWGGETFAQLQRFAHTHVRFIDYSPCETYLVTCVDPTMLSIYSDDPNAIMVWHIRTGEPLRSFPAGKSTHVDMTHWPHFKWSHDDKYFCATKKDQGISIYETPSMFLLDKKTVKVERLREVQWSPKQNYLAYWIEEQGSLPARVTLMRVPDKTELRTSNMFRVVHATLHWQPSGEHLAVSVERYGNKKWKEKEGEYNYTTLTYQLEIFRVQEKDIPVDSVELAEPLVSFCWEPDGNKFCALLGSSRKSTPTFYAITKGSIQCIKTLESQQSLNTISWAPAGGWLVIGSLKGPYAAAGTGMLIFVDANGNDVQKVNIEEHPLVSQVSFDPTGRYAATVVTKLAGARAADFGYRIYSSQGRRMYETSVEMLQAFQWRPRPPSLLPDTKVKEIKKNMKEYTKMFEEQDRRERGRATKEVVERRRTLAGDFDKWRSALAQQMKVDANKLELAYKRDELEMEEEHIQVPITTERIVLESKQIQE